MILPSGILHLDLGLFIRGLIHFLPLQPHPQAHIELLPILIGAGELLGAKYRIHGDDDELIVGDWVSGTHKNLLSILQSINVLQYSFLVQMKALHLILKRENVEGVQTPADRLEMADEVRREDLSVKRGRSLQFADPSILNNGENKMLVVALRGFLGLEIGELGRVLCLQAISGGRLGIFVYSRAIYARASGVQEIESIRSHIVGLVQDDTDEIFLALLLIIRYDE